VTSLSDKDFLVYRNGIVQDIQAFDRPTKYQVLSITECASPEELAFTYQFVDFLYRQLKPARSRVRMATAEFLPLMKLGNNWNLLELDSAQLNTSRCPSAGNVKFADQLKWASSQFTAAKGASKGLTRNHMIWAGIVEKLPMQSNNGKDETVGRVVEWQDDQEFKAALGTVRDSGIVVSFVTFQMDCCKSLRYSGNAADQRIVQTGDHNEAQRVERLRVLAQASGGQLVVAQSYRETQGLVDTILRAAASYRLRLHVPGSEEPRQFDVKVKKQALRVIEVRTLN
jgi:hypothetical protein